MSKAVALIRTDGNTEIGYGHVMRMLALATIISDDFDICFLCKNVTDWIKQEISQKYSFIEIPISITYCDEAGFISKNLPEDSAIMIFDGYYFDTAYQISIRSNIDIRTISIDDFQPFGYVTDAVINHAGMLNREQFQLAPHTQLYTGPQYALLREEFNKVAAEPIRHINQISTGFICMGGTDPDVYESIIHKLREASLTRIIIVVSNRDKFNYIQQQYEEVELHSNMSARGMISLMKQSDIAILPSSTLCYEYSSVGGGLFVIQTAENQKFIHNFIINSSCAVDFKDFNKTTLQIIQKQLMIQKELFRGENEKNIRKILYKIISENKITIRKANTFDALKYYEWVNEEKVRDNSINTKKIELNSHIKWFDNKINSKNTILFYFEFDFKPLGQVRFDLILNTYEIDYSIDKAFRSNGLATIMLKKAIEELKRTSKPHEIIGKVKYSNFASLKVFENIGFILSGQEVINEQIYNIYLLA